MSQNRLTSPGERERTILPPFARYLTEALAGTAGVWLLARWFGVYPPWAAILSVLALSVPIALAAFYHTVVGRIHRATLYRKGGWIHRWISGRGLRFLFWTLWAVGTSFFMLIQLHIFGPLEWGVLLLTIPVFWGMYRWSSRRLAGEVAAYWRTRAALGWARRLTSILMVVLYCGAIWLFGAGAVHGSVGEAMAAHRALTADISGSALVREAAQWLADFGGARAYLLQGVALQNPVPGLALLALGGGVVFYNAGLMLSCLLIPQWEYRRILADLTPDPIPGPVSRSLLGNLVFWSVIGTLAMVFGFGHLDSWVEQSPEFRQARQAMEKRVIQIGDTYYHESVVPELEKAKARALRRVDVPLARLEGQLDQAFDRMEANLDLYLDWYYSLGGEYGRIGSMLAGDMEAYMGEKLEEALQHGDLFRGVQEEVQSLLLEHREAQRAYQAEASRILEEHRVAPGSPVEVVRQLSLEQVMSPPVRPEVITLGERLGGSAVAAGVAGAYVVKKVAGKAMAKATSKLALKTLGKFAAKKAAGAGAGALVGGTVGSVVPVLGTAIGAALGGIITWVATDAAFLSLEEAVSRDAYKKEILAAIKEIRREFKASLQ